MYRQIKILFLFLLVLLTSLLAPTITLGQNNLPFYWESINVEIDVQTNGDMLITETQKYVFTAEYSKERYRYILLDKIDKITDVEVFEGEEKLPIKTRIRNNQLWIKWRHELNPPEAHTFVLKYRVIGGLRISDQSDKVSWKAIFPNREASIQNAKVIVRFPDSISGNTLKFISFGVATNNRQIDPKTIEFVSTKALLPQQQIEVLVIFPHGILDIPVPDWELSEANQDSSLWEISFSPAILMFFPAILILIFWGYLMSPITTFTGNNSTRNSSTRNSSTRNSSTRNSSTRNNSTGGGGSPGVGGCGGGGCGGGGGGGGGCGGGGCGGGGCGGGG
ncbi:MAG: DUF2207 domain-containing protein [Symploca sp. SIO3C6]|uniref:DUF2207 domain-containing protein n=1 Tax=Symploca sp. SIO1C4 TaxID=2607765 RepID=A0A6B3NGX1_9CYAN|nr:DUF2207 domain-containing protein [Symploca sp. SIO3C6]NER30910.1 DUF2207 domain-containing protein [Symploca sp. SIO1C4]